MTQCSKVATFGSVSSLLKSAAAAAFHHAGGLASVRWRNFQEAGHPVFAEYRIPVTVFLVTDFLDGKSWLWFDRVVYAFQRAKVSDASIEMPGGNALHFKLDSAAARGTAGQHLADLAVALSPADRRELVAKLPRLLQVEMPEQAPPEYRPLSWDAVRSLASSGVEFGAHTKTHPILSALADPEELREEIAEISEANRLYLQGGKKMIGASDQERRLQRLQEIMDELMSLTDWKKT